MVTVIPKEFLTVAYNLVRMKMQTITFRYGGDILFIPKANLQKTCDQSNPKL